MADWRGGIETAITAIVIAIFAATMTFFILSCANEYSVIG
jgi:hypothetical protein